MCVLIYVCMFLCMKFYEFCIIIEHAILQQCYLDPEKTKDGKVSHTTSLNPSISIQAYGAAARIQPPWDCSEKPPLNHLNNTTFNNDVTFDSRFFTFQNPWARQLSWNWNVSAPAGKVHAACICKTGCEGCLAEKPVARNFIKDHHCMSVETINLEQGLHGRCSSISGSWHTKNWQNL